MTEKKMDAPQGGGMTADMKIAPTGLALLMVPFEANEVGKLPKPTKAQTEAVKADFKVGVRCDVCGGWHHPKVVHLDYIGHAALTKRLLQADPLWTWEPMALAPDGTPLMDKNGGMWIRLTVCGVTRLGYGFADGKSGGDAIKETIGDALRNAAMRFGAALELWHKGDLYDEEELRSMGVETTPPPTGRMKETQPSPVVQKEKPPGSTPVATQDKASQFANKVLAEIKACQDAAAIDAVCQANDVGLKKLKAVAGERWNEISDAITAKHDAFRFPPSDEDARRQAEMRPFDALPNVIGVNEIKGDMANFNYGESPHKPDDR